jgi:RHS repeat-associated protein
VACACTLWITLPAAASNGTVTYTFNAADQLTQVSSSTSGVLASFTYDGDGQRIKKTVGSDQIIYVRGSLGEVIAEHVYVDGTRLCKITSEQGVERRVCYHGDVVGTPLALTNESGRVIARAEYQPSGEEVLQGAWPDRHTFTGKELDDETGLHYFGARYYSARLGRFISVDPVGGKNEDPQSWNRYAYARNNPLRFVDPDGRLTVIIPGTFSRDAKWAQPGAPFNQAVSRTFGEEARVLPWSHGNTEAARAEAAAELRKLAAEHKFAEGERLNIVAHSRGGNVALHAMEKGGLGRPVDTLVTLGTPVRADYGLVHNPRIVRQDICVYSWQDAVQSKGGETLGIEAGLTYSRIRQGAINLSVPGASHSGLHTPAVWTTHIEPWITSGK